MPRHAACGMRHVARAACGRCGMRQVAGRHAACGRLAGRQAGRNCGFDDDYYYQYATNSIRLLVYYYVNY